TTRDGGINVTATNITLGNNLSTNSIATAGNVNLVGSVTLAGSPTITTDASSTDANITITGATNADLATNNRSLTLSPGDGAVIFPYTDTLGATQPLNTFTVTSGSNAYLPSITCRRAGR